MSGSFPTGDMALTHILVVSDVPESNRWYQEVLGAEPYREYETSAVLSFNGGLASSGRGRRSNTGQA